MSKSGREPTPERVTFPTLAFATLDRRIRALANDISIVEQSGTRRYHRGERLFAVVKPFAKRVDVGFYKFGRARSKRILHARGHLPFVPYRVIVEAPGDVDTELMAWLHESYDLAAEGTSV